MTKCKTIGLIFLAASLAVGACSGSGAEVECKKDSDCQENWICDIYGNYCRCVNDDGCNTAIGERCTTAGTCEIYTGCKTDQDCAGCQRCEIESGECLCTDDCGCAEGEKCNASGYCQPSSGCFDNADCAQGEICNTPTKTCIPANTCTSKFQCPLGQICTGGTCVDGCEDHGDCPWENDVKSACMDGSCVAGVCGDDSFCDFMEYCNNGNCLSAYDEQDAPYCRPCDNMVLDTCGPVSNPCLIYPYLPPEEFAQVSDEYCAVDCSEGQRCPNGFECSSIISIKQTDLCQTDNDCPLGLPCLKGAEEDEGFCPCHPMKNACPENTCLMDTCGTITHKCFALGLAGLNVPCTTNADCQLCQVTWDSCNSDADCEAIDCEIYDGVDYGGCVSAKGCGLQEGYHCPPP
jgi:hypothetical protein